MKLYSREERLKLTERVYTTKEVNKILNKQRIKQKLSKAKIVCNLVIKEYSNNI